MITSTAALFRSIDRHPGRLLFLDEASKLSSRDYADLINTGHRRNGAATRYDVSLGRDVQFSVYGPKIFAENKSLRPGALETRCVPVAFVEAPMDFVPVPRESGWERDFRIRARAWIRKELDRIRDAHARWRRDASFFRSQRMRQIYSPLFAVAEVAGSLDPLREYAAADHERRSRRHILTIGDRLDSVLEGLLEYCRGVGLPKGAIPFSSIRTFVLGELDGESASDKAIRASLVRKGYEELSSRPRGQTCYAAPSSGLFGKLVSIVKNGSK